MRTQQRLYIGGRYDDTRGFLLAKQLRPKDSLTPKTANDVQRNPRRRGGCQASVYWCRLHRPCARPSIHDCFMIAFRSRTERAYRATAHRPSSAPYLVVPPKRISDLLHLPQHLSRRRETLHRTRVRNVTRLAEQCYEIECNVMPD